MDILYALSTFNGSPLPVGLIKMLYSLQPATIPDRAISYSPDMSLALASLCLFFWCIFQRKEKEHSLPYRPVCFV
jgi:hypothetical protein